MSPAPAIVEATRETFRDMVAEGTVLVDVWGPDCHSCLALMPHVEILAQRHEDDIRVVKLEAPKARRLCMELGIMGMPAFVLFRDGVEVGRLADPALSADRLDKWVDEQIKEVS